MPLPEVDPHKLISHPVFAGLMGAIVVGLRETPGTTWVERILNAVAGGLLAGYGSPALAELWALRSDALQGALAFFIGMFGMSLMAAVVEGIKSIPFGEIVSSYLRRKP